LFDFRLELVELHTVEGKFSKFWLHILHHFCTFSTIFHAQTADICRLFGGERAGIFHFSMVARCSWVVILLARGHCIETADRVIVWGQVGRQKGSRKGKRKGTKKGTQKATEREHKAPESKVVP